MSKLGDTGGLSKKSCRLDTHLLQNDELECGAIAENGRECLIVWRGKQRAEVFLIEGGDLKTRQSFGDPNECDAFRQAAEMGLAWLKNLPQ